MSVYDDVLSAFASGDVQERGIWIYNGFKYAGCDGKAFIRVPTTEENSQGIPIDRSDLFAHTWGSTIYTHNDPDEYDDDDQMVLIAAGFEWAGPFWFWPLRYKILFPQHEYRYAASNPISKPIRLTDGTAEVVLLPVVEA